MAQSALVVVFVGRYGRPAVEFVARAISSPPWKSERAPRWQGAIRARSAPSSAPSAPSAPGASSAPSAPAASAPHHHRRPGGALPSGMLLVLCCGTASPLAAGCFGGRYA